MAFFERILTGVVLAAGLSLVVAVVAGGCDRGQMQSEDDSSATDGVDEPPESLFRTQGDGCSGDDDCSGYLRCIEETCQIPPAVEGRSDEETPVVQFHRSTDGEMEKVAEFYVELAATADARRRGLMYRRKMADGWGMLFVYKDEKPRSFWMKQTYMPLDMVFMDAEGRVLNIVESAEPETLEPRRSEGAARFVLELEGGTAKSTGIEPGLVMSTDNVPESQTPAR